MNLLNIIGMIAKSDANLEIRVPSDDAGCAVPGGIFRDVVGRKFNDSVVESDSSGVAADSGTLFARPSLEAGEDAGQVDEEFGDEAGLFEAIGLLLAGCAMVDAGMAVSVENKNNASEVETDDCSGDDGNQPKADMLLPVAVAAKAAEAQQPTDMILTQTAIPAVRETVALPLTAELEAEGTPFGRENAAVPIAAQPDVNAAPAGGSEILSATPVPESERADSLPVDATPVVNSEQQTVWQSMMSADTAPKSESVASADTASKSESVAFNRHVKIDAAGKIVKESGPARPEYSVSAIRSDARGAASAPADSSGGTAAEAVLTGTPSRDNLMPEGGNQAVGTKLSSAPVPDAAVARDDTAVAGLEMSGKSPALTDAATARLETADAGRSGAGQPASAGFETSVTSDTQSEASAVQAQKPSTGNDQADEERDGRDVLRNPAEIKTRSRAVPAEADTVFRPEDVRADNARIKSASPRISTLAMPESEVSSTAGVSSTLAQMDTAAAVTGNDSSAAATAQSSEVTAERVERLQDLLASLDEHVLQSIDGRDKDMVIRLVPANLGRVQMHCSAQDGQVRVEMVVENGAVQNLIQQQENALRNILQQAGYRLEQFDVRSQNDEAGARFERNRSQSAKKGGRVSSLSAVKPAAEAEVPAVGAVGYRHNTGRDGIWFVA